MQLSALLSKIPVAQASYGSDDPIITGVTSRSQEVKKGSLFVCLQGLHHDGHAFALEAVKKGAAAILCEDPARLPDDSLPYIVTPNTHRALAILCAAFAGNPQDRLKLIAVTGTNGKTSTVHMIGNILFRAGFPTAILSTIGNYLDHQPLPDSGMTTADPEFLYPVLANICNCRAEYVVMEASSHALALEKLAPISFEIGIFTNLTPEHLDFHQNMGAYAAAKAALFSQCKQGLLHLDSPYHDQILAEARCPCLDYSLTDTSAPFYMQNPVSLGTDGISYDFCWKNKSLRITCPIPGNFTYDNTMAAMSCAAMLGLDLQSAADALGNLQGVRGRMERVVLPLADFDVFLDYAHTPDALERLLRSIRAIRRKDQRLVLLFGCGGDRDESKRAPMGKIASELADFIILTQDNSRTEDPARILDEIERGMFENTPHIRIPERKNAIRYAILHAQKHDFILLAGKGHETYEIRADGKHPFNERRLLLDAYAARLAGSKD